MSACRLKIAALGLLVALSGCRTVPVPAPSPTVPGSAPMPDPATAPGTSGSPAPASASVAAAAQETAAVAIDAGTAEAPAVPTGTVPSAVPACLPAASASRPPRERPKSQARTAVSAAPALPQAPGRADRRAESEQEPVAVASVLGRKVEDSHGDDVGRVVDVLADADGRVRLAIIEYGGFLGVGNRRVAIDWSLLRFATGEDRPVSLSVSQETLQQAPEYKTSPRPMALTVPPQGAK